MATAIIVFILLSACLFTSSEGKCRGKTKCTGLRECAPYMALVMGTPKPLKASVVNFLRAQECGFQNGYPKVCCGVIPRGIKLFKDLKPVSSTTVQPSINLLSNVEEIGETINYAQNFENVKAFDGGKMTRFESYKHMTPSFDITVATAPPFATPVPYLNFKSKQKKMDELNQAFAETTDFDLFRRGVRSSVYSGLDIEVR